MGLGASKTADGVFAEHSECLAGKTVLVTGSNGGLARSLLAALVRNTKVGAVILHCRTLAAAEAVADQLKCMASPPPDDSAIPYSKPELIPMECDLSDLTAVAGFARRVCQLDKVVEVVVCLAGVATIPTRRVTKDGYEAQFAINHLAHFLLIDRLLPKIAPAAISQEEAVGQARSDAPRARPRVVIVSSDVTGIKRAHLDFDDLQSENNYSMFGAYIRSKLANVLHAKELHRRYHDAMDVVACTPGTVPDTGIARELGPGLRFAFRYMGPGLLGKSPNRGAATIAHCVASPVVSSGGFYSECKLVDAVGGQCDDASIATQLWDASTHLVEHIE